VGEKQLLRGRGITMTKMITEDTSNQLYENGKIIVNRDQSPAVPGFFAAGDATDEPDKVVIAAGAGAKAAQSADRYLSSLRH